MKRDFFGAKTMQVADIIIVIPAQSRNTGLRELALDRYSKASGGLRIGARKEAT